MPITASAKKALRQNRTRHTRNVTLKTRLKTAIKSYRKAVGAKNDANLAAAYRDVQKTIDKTARAGVIKKNTADRLKSRLAQLAARSTRASS